MSTHGILLTARLRGLIGSSRVRFMDEGKRVKIHPPLSAGITFANFTSEIFDPDEDTRASWIALHSAGGAGLTMAAYARATPGNTSASLVWP